jgi:hypothetical protein
MKHAATRALYAYWDRLRAGRTAPERGEIDPTAIPRLLPDVALFELRESGAIAVRLAGTRLCDLFARELRGAAAAALWTPPCRGEIDRVLRTVMGEAAAAVVAVTGRREGREPLPGEMLALPLADAAGRPCFAIASLALFAGMEALCRGERIDALTAESARLSWPGGRPEEDPFTPLGPLAAHDRRRVGRFVVYDGGRDPAAEGAATSR